MGARLLALTLGPRKRCGPPPLPRPAPAPPPLPRPSLQAAPAISRPAEAPALPDVPVEDISSPAFDLPDLVELAPESIRTPRSPTLGRIGAVSLQPVEGDAARVRYVLDPDEAAATRARFAATARALVRIARRSTCARLLHAESVALDGSSFVGASWSVGTVADVAALGWGLEDKLALIRWVIDAVAVLHAEGVFVGDLDPARIYFDDDLRPVVTALPAAAGRPSVYVAPEAGGGRIDAPADVFAIGRLMCFVLLERDPDAGVEALPRLEALAALPPGLVRIVRRCVAADAAARYASVDALASDLCRYGEAATVGAAHPAAVDEDPSRIRRRTVGRGAATTPQPAATPPSGGLVVRSHRPERSRALPIAITAVLLLLAVATFFLGRGPDLVRGAWVGAAGERSAR